MEMDRRKELLLEAIVESYVARAEPVGSEFLVSARNLGVGPATIRNEMAELTHQGYLRQPHTSAGRVPSTLGYRYYVDHLMEWARLAPAAARSLRGISRLTEGDVEQLLMQTCRLLSSLTGYTAMAVPPTGADPGIRSAHLVQMEGSRVLVVVVLDNGRVIHRFTDLTVMLSPAEVTRLSNGLDELLRGTPARPGAPAAQPVVPAELAQHEETLRALISLVQRTLPQQSEEAFLEGTRHMLEQPEFRDADRVEPLIRLLEERRSMFEELRALLANERLTVVIGEENPHAPMRECSVMMAHYRAGDRMAGWIGILGPTRLQYEQTAPAVHLAAQSLTEAFSRIGLP